MNLRLIDDFRTLLASHDQLALVVLFGSQARGTARAASDVDIAVLPTGELSSTDEAELVKVIERVALAEVDLVRLDRTDNVILRREIAHGIALREGAPGAFARFAANAALEWLDLEPAYIDAQARYLRRVAQGSAPR